MKFRVIVVTDPQTHKPTHKPPHTNPQTGPIVIYCTAASAQCKNDEQSCLGTSSKSHSCVLTGCNRPSAGITSAISKFSAAAQRGVAPGAGSGALSISDDERRRILEEEQRQLDILKVSFSPLQLPWFLGRHVRALEQESQ